MKCPKCHQEVEGNFCSFCGATLPGANQPIPDPNAAGNDDLPEISWEPLEIKKEPVADTSSDTSRSINAKKTSGSNRSTGTQKISAGSNRNSASVQTQTTVTRKKTKTKTKKKRSKNLLRSTASTIGSAATGSAKSLWKLLILCAQWLSAGLMLFATWHLFRGFWDNRTVLGSISSILQERNLAQAVFLMLGFFLVLFGVLEGLWILGRRKMPDHGKIRRIDTGRGLLAFVFFLLVFLAAKILTPLLPSSPSPFIGVKQAFQVIANLGNSFFYLHAAGAILCIIRKVGTR